MSVMIERDIDRPHELPAATGRPSWGIALKRAGAKFSLDQCTDKAAALTYFSVQSLFPGLIAVMSLLNIFGNGRATTTKLVQIIAGVMGKDPHGKNFQLVTSFIDHVQAQGGGGIALVIGLVGALWSASGYVGGFSRALNKIYDVPEGRPVWKLRPQMLLVTAIEVVLIVIVMVLLVISGSLARQIGQVIGLGDQAVTVWSIAKWPVVVIIVVLVIGMLYWATPNVRKLKRDIFSWGALAAFIVWVLGSVALVVYIGLTHGAGYQKTYGAFAYVIVFLLWLWITNIAMLFGAELDAELIRTRQLRSGLDAEVVVQLPPKDDRGWAKQRAKYKRAIAAAVALRDDDRTSDGRGATPGGSLASSRSARQTGGASTSKDGEQMDAYDSTAAHAQVVSDRSDRRAAALKKAKADRKVRDRLERQEQDRRKRFNAALKQVKKERARRQSFVTQEEQRSQEEQVRAKYAPKQTPQRDLVEAEQRARRASFDAEQQRKRAEKAARPPEPPKPKKARKPKHHAPAMPSPLRSQISEDQAKRRADWYSAHDVRG